MKKLGIACAALGVTALAAAVAACSSTSTPAPSGTSGTTGDAATPPANGITVQSNQFVPATLTVKVGDTVTWTWAGGAHTVTSGANCTSDGQYGTNGTQSAAGATFTRTYTTAGTFEFFCEPHCVSSGMKGSIVVK